MTNGEWQVSEGGTFLDDHPRLDLRPGLDLR